MSSEERAGAAGDRPDGPSFADKLLERSRARKRAASGAAPLRTDRVECRRAAALLTGFDPRRLRVPGRPELIGSATLALLVDDCVSLSPRGNLHWRLRKEVRDAALESFTSPREALEYLEANMDQVATRSSAWFARELLLGNVPGLTTLSIDHLTRLRKAISWLRLVPGTSGLPDAVAVKHALERARLLEPLEQLLRETFEGRTDELTTIERHLGLVRRGLRDTVTRSLTARWAPRDDYPLVVYGPGGIGKSTLIARSLLDHLTSDDVGQFPFVYVDAERATVDLDEPTSLVAEMARQLGTQYPEHADELADIAATASVWSRNLRARREEIDDLRGGSTTRALSRGAARSYHTASRDDGAQLIARLGQVLAEATGPDHPTFVVALDSFEEAQYRASPVLDRMWAMLYALEEVYPNTRVVVAGRAPIGHPTIDVTQVPTLELTDLDDAAAQRFLVDRRVDGTLAADVVARIGGNPLNLQLAAKVCASPDGADHDDLLRHMPARRRRVFGAVDDMLIQGMLYDRVLMHIRDREVRRLAHPGLVLRRITPEVIEHVLAPVCGVAIDSPTKASELFEELARELDLVDRVAPDVLKHRSDVRRVMLRLLKADRNPDVTAVEEAAVQWFAGKDSTADRAEEIYHRLRLGRELEVVSARWRPELRPHLLDVAAEELPGRSAKLLSRLLDGTPDTLPERQQAEWEQDAAEEAENLLAQGFVEDALAVVGRRRPWTIGSPLHALNAEILMQLGRQEEARTAVAAALDEPGIEQFPDQQLELLLLSARLAAEASDWAAADADLDVAERVALRLGHDLDSLGVLLLRARLLDALPDLATSAIDEDARAALVTRVRQVPDELLSSRPALFRAVAGEIGGQEADVLAHAIDLVGLPALSQSDISVLSDAIVETMDQANLGDVLASFAHQSRQHWSSPRPADVRQFLDETSRTGRLDELAKHLLGAHDQSGALQRGIAAAMQEEASPLSSSPYTDLSGAWHAGHPGHAGHEPGGRA
ncbi:MULTISPECIES: hypothetical protein [unclassified Nocardioides]|uniref:hypothetical protein n=1 Tax=unclassified Nocardioides TaxID=2615069 RepID=UPI003616EC21